MIKEWIQSLITPVESHIRKMGYLKESIAMEARYQRCRPEWQIHFDHCQQAILEAAARCDRHHTVLILGAGSLKDIPLASLSEKFERVVLVDVVFLKSAHQTVRSFANVELVAADVSGSLLDLYAGKPQVSSFTRWLGHTDIDCVVSLNLVTQLPLLPVDWLMNKYQISELILGELGRQMVQNHLDYLNQFKAVKCLIADRKVTERDNQNQVIDEIDPLWQVTLPDVEIEWEWQTAPLGEISRKVSKSHSVGVSIWA